MNPQMETVLFAAGVAAGSVLFAAIVLSHIRMASQALAEACLRAPLLDLIVAGFSWIPWVAVAIWGGRWPLLGCLTGQIAGLILWCWYHELSHRQAAKGPRIVKYLNRRVGRVRNHLALWITAIAYPIFWGVRFGEVFVYPMLVWTVRLPRYKQAEWVNVSRTKFDGLVGHDLIWCLYCDWMTGVYSLGAEMLRNVESFWCPLRFYDGKKCENCKIDFPDIEKGWIKADGTMQEVVTTMAKHYDGGDHSWWNHPKRTNLTREGNQLK